MNIWGMSHDESVYPSPDEFKPERFWNNDQELPYSFGAGRRVCVGQSFAENSLMLVMAKVAWAFDISASLGCSIDPNVQTGYNDGLSIAPKRFEVELRVRSKRHEDAISLAMDML